MSELVVNREVSRDDTWIRGEKSRYDSEGNLESVTEWMQLTDDAHRDWFWFTYPTREVFERLDMTVSDENIKQFEDIFQDDIAFGYSYVHACAWSVKDKADRVMSMVFNDATELVNRRRPGEAVYDVFPAVAIAYLVNPILQDFAWIERKHFKDMLERLLDGDSFESIIKDDRYAKSDSSEADPIIDAVLEESGSRYDGTNKVFNWLVGQVMKASRGKADASYVKERMKEKLDA